jgi:hypothetical protein
MRAPPSFFESLRILLPKIVKQCRVKIWHVPTREKSSLAGTLVHLKNKALPSLPIGIKVEGEGEDD